VPLLRTAAADAVLQQQPFSSSSFSSSSSATTNVNITDDNPDSDIIDTPNFYFPIVHFSDHTVTNRIMFESVLAAARCPPAVGEEWCVSILEPYGESAAPLWPDDADAPLVLHDDPAHASLCAALLAVRASRLGVPFLSLAELRAELPRHLDAEAQQRFLPPRLELRLFLFEVLRCGFSLCCVNVNTASSLLALPAVVSDVFVCLCGGVSSSALLLADGCLCACVDQLLRALPLLRRHAVDSASALASHAPASFARDRTLLVAQGTSLLQWWAVSQLCSGATLIGAPVLDDSELAARAMNALRGAGMQLRPERVESLLRTLLALSDCFARAPLSSLDADQVELLDALLLRELGSALERSHHRTVDSAALTDVVLPALRDYYLTRTDSAAHARRHTTDDYASAEATLSGAVDYVQATTGVCVSRSFVYRRLLPRVPGSHEARRHVVEIRVRPAAPVKVAIDSAVDSHYCAALVRLRRLAFGSLPFERDAYAPSDSTATFLSHALTIARDDKARVHLTNSAVLRPQV
jgi:hypothetical protein